MHMLRRTSLFLVFMVLVNFVFSSNAFASAPVVQSVSYNEKVNALEISFDQLIQYDSILLGRITLDGGPNQSVTLTGGTILQTENSSVITVMVNHEDQKAIETMTDNTSLELVLAPDVFINENGEGNNRVTIDDNIAINYIADPDPDLLSAVYDAEKNSMTLEFSVAMDNKANLDGLMYYNQDGTQNDTLKNAELVQDPDNLNVLTLNIPVMNQETFETFAMSGEVYLQVAPFTFMDSTQYANGNDKISYSDNFGVQVLTEAQATELTGAFYDYGTNELLLTFNEVVQYENVNLLDFKVTDGTMNVFLQGATVQNENDNDSLLLKFEPWVNNVLVEKAIAVQESLEVMMVPGEKTIQLESFAVFDTLMNGNFPLQRPLETTSDDNPTRIEKVEYDPSSNSVVVYFNESMLNNPVYPEGITLHGEGMSYTLTSGEVQERRPSDKLTLTLLTRDSEPVEDLLKVSINPTVTIDAFTFLDENGNGNGAVQGADELNVNVLEEYVVPTLDSVTYDANANLLKFYFFNQNGPGDFRRRDYKIVYDRVKIEQIALDGDFGGSNPNLNLSGGEVVETRDSYDITIELLEPDYKFLERMSDKNSLVVTMAPNTFINKTANGNKAITIQDSVAVRYMPDTTPPYVLSAKYNFDTNQVKLTFSSAVKYDVGNINNIVIDDDNGGSNPDVRLSGGSIANTVDSVTIVIDISSTDREKIEKMSDLTHMELILDQGSFENVDGVGNVPVTGVAPDSVHFKYGRAFWDRDWAVFPELDRHVEASLYAVGEHCYIYAQDSEWGESGAKGSGSGDSLTVSEGVTWEKVNTVLEMYEKSSPTDPSKGVHQVLKQTYGEPPMPPNDIDGDPRVYILIMDVRDYYDPTAALPADPHGADDYLGSYFDARNQLPKSENPHSNEVEMVYLDCYPQRILPSSFIKNRDTAGAFLTRAVSDLILWGRDDDEESWLQVGLNLMAEFMVGYTDPDTSNSKNLVVTGMQGYDGKRIQFPVYNSLTFLPTVPQDLSADLDQVYLHFMYLYEKYGEKELLKAIAADTLNGISSLKNVLESLPSSLYKYPYQSYEKVYDDWALASFLDIENPDFYGGRYGYDNLELAPPSTDYPKWRKADLPYYEQEDTWSTRFWLTQGSKPGQFDSVLVFNGVDEENFSVYGAELMTSFTDVQPKSIADIYGGESGIKQMQLDEEQEGTLLVTPIQMMEDGEMVARYNSFVHLVSTRSSNRGTMPSEFVITTDTNAPDYLDLGVHQNPIFDNFLDIYVFADEKLFIDNDIEAPNISVTFDSTKDNNETVTIERSVPVDSFYTISDSAFSYHGRYILSGPGTYMFMADGQDRAGNAAPAATVQVDVSFVVAESGGNMLSKNGSVNLAFPSGAFEKDTYVTLITEKETSNSVYQSLGELYLIGPENKRMNKSAQLLLSYTDNTLSDAEEKQLGIFRKEGDQWIYIGGKINPERNTISAKIDRLGEYKIMADASIVTSTLPTEYKLSQNFPNPFNPTTEIQYQIPERGVVEISITNILGQVVRHLVNKEIEAGYHSVMWDGTNDAGENVASGIYLYKIKANDYTQMKKMILVR